MSLSEPPLDDDSPSPAVLDGPLRNVPRGAASKVAGAGLGTAIIFWAQHAGFSPTATQLMEVAAPSVAIFLSWVGPPVSRYIIIQGRLWGLHRTLKRARQFANNCQDGTAAHKKALANVHELELMIADLMKAEGMMFKDKK
jgi:hypothetical protein